MDLVSLPFLARAPLLPQADDDDEKIVLDRRLWRPCPILSQGQLCEGKAVAGGVSRNEQLRSKTIK
jgi:hypothetical protein|tara:strand:- start:1019 stop:1216 length:198 start_codon:yes stop_codon:yes gene_type:complete